MSELPKLTLVIGGVSSGKSRWAEGLIGSSTLDLVYIATATAGDAEMAEKIAAHKSARGSVWRTLEAPLDLPSALNTVAPGEAVLIDCLSMWLTNHLLAKTPLAPLSDTLLARLDSMISPVVIVSNEVGMGGIADNPLARQFQREQGLLNQRLATRADLAVLVVAGLPHILKGTQP
jgi:adenosylcobinamide kinase / adenosylcobinamide-phosphate guanylyltransferase